MSNNTYIICPFTGQEIQNLSENADGYTYSVSMMDEDFEFNVCGKCFRRVFNSQEIRSKQSAIAGLLLNKKIVLNSARIHWDDGREIHSKNGINLYNDVENNVYPTKPQDKLDNFFSELYKLQKFEGDEVTITTTKKSAKAWLKYFFSDPDELMLYFNALTDNGYLQETGQDKDSLSYCFTYKGLNHYISISEEGFKSNKCFIAMAFTNKTLHIRDAIKRAVIATGFEPIIIDEKHINTDRTINDEIIANLKKSKFCIGDFCHHRRGVYFETGFALGQGKPVIFTCQQKYFRLAHFDTKPLQHIIYETAEELEQKLIHKIEAWIK